MTRRIVGWALESQFGQGFWFGEANCCKEQKITPPPKTKISKSLELTFAKMPRFSWQSTKTRGRHPSSYWPGSLWGGGMGVREWVITFVGKVWSGAEGTHSCIACVGRDSLGEGRKTSTWAWAYLFQSCVSESVCARRVLFAFSQNKPFMEFKAKGSVGLVPSQAARETDLGLSWLLALCWQLLCSLACETSPPSLSPSSPGFLPVCLHLHMAFSSFPKDTSHLGFVVVVELLCLTLCDHMDCSTRGFPILHFLLEFDQTHVHWISDAIQPSHPLSSSFVFNLSQHQSLFQWNQLFISSGQSIGASTSAFPMNIQGWFPLGWTGLSSVQSKGLSKVFSTLMTSSELDHTYFQLRSYGLGLDLIWGSSF